MASRRERRRKRRKGKTPSKQQERQQEEATTSVQEQKRKKGGLADFYDRNYKKLMIIPFSILVAAIALIIFQIATTGDFIDKDVSLKGGLTLTALTKEHTPDDIETFLSQRFPQADIRARALTEFGSQTGLIIDASDLEQEDMLSALEERIPDVRDIYSVESIGPELGASFFRQTMISILVAFVFMSIVVFLYFRTLVPSAAVILAAFSDIVVTIAVLNIMDIRLSTAGIAALLMLIGYSVDTDILLSTRVLKAKEGTVMERITSAVKTGLTMNATTLAAILVALIISESETITQIMTILLIGLLIDVVNTWIQNAGILKWYVERKRG